MSGDFGGGFGFEFDAAACEACGGKCCAGERGAVWISEDECAAAAAFVGVGVAEFKARFTRLLGGRRSLREVVDEGGDLCVDLCVAAGGGGGNFGGNGAGNRGGNGENDCGNGAGNRGGNLAENHTKPAPNSNLAQKSDQNGAEILSNSNLDENGENPRENLVQNPHENGKKSSENPCEIPRQNAKIPRQNPAQTSWACEFLDQTSRRCTIYPVRPRQCRTFPFWSAFRGDFSELAAECAGVRLRPTTAQSAAHQSAATQLAAPQPTQNKGKK